MTDHATHVLDALAALRTAIAADVPEQELTPFLDVAVAIVRGEPGYDREAMVAAAAPPRGGQRGRARGGTQCP